MVVRNFLRAIFVYGRSVEPDHAHAGRLKRSSAAQLLSRSTSNEVSTERHTNDGVEDVVLDYVVDCGDVGRFTRTKAQRAFMRSHDWPESSMFWSRANTQMLVERLIDANTCIRTT